MMSYILSKREEAVRCPIKHGRATTTRQRAQDNKTTIGPPNQTQNPGISIASSYGSGEEARRAASADRSCAKTNRTERRTSNKQQATSILVVLPSGKISIVDVVVTHPAQLAYVSQACTRVGHAAARAEAAKVAEFRRIGEVAGQYDFVPFAVESYGRLGASAQTFLKALGSVAPSRGTISQAAFV
jgi:hypothetical protein